MRKGSAHAQEEGGCGVRPAAVAKQAAEHAGQLRQGDDVLFLHVLAGLPGYGLPQHDRGKVFHGSLQAGQVGCPCLEPGIEPAGFRAGPGLAGLVQAFGQGAAFDLVQVQIMDGLGAPILFRGSADLCELVFKGVPFCLQAFALQGVQQAAGRVQGIFKEALCVEGHFAAIDLPSLFRQGEDGPGHLHGALADLFCGKALFVVAAGEGMHGLAEKLLQPLVAMARLLGEPVDNGTRDVIHVEAGLKVRRDAQLQRRKARHHDQQAVDGAHVQPAVIMQEGLDRVCGRDHQTGMVTCPVPEGMHGRIVFPGRWIFEGDLLEGGDQALAHLAGRLVGEGDGQQVFPSVAVSFAAFFAVAAAPGPVLAIAGHAQQLQEYPGQRIGLPRSGGGLYLDQRAHFPSMSEADAFDRPWGASKKRAGGGPAQSAMPGAALWSR